MRSEASKNRQYGLGWPPLGDNEEDSAVYTSCVCVCLSKCVRVRGKVGVRLECALKLNRKKVVTRSEPCVSTYIYEYMTINSLSFSESWCSLCQSFMFIHERGGEERIP